MTYAQYQVQTLHWEIWQKYGWNKSHQAPRPFCVNFELLEIVRFRQLSFICYYYIK